MKDRKKLIGYVTTEHLPWLKPEDVKALDVINIAFGTVKENRIDWACMEAAESMEIVRAINPELKIILSVGGWGCGGFSEMASTEAGRKEFAQSAKYMVEKFRLDGVDLDWEYPCIGVAGIGAAPEDKENFTLLLREIREFLDTIDGEKKILSIAAGGDTYYIRCTEIAKVAEIVDYIQLMSYDLRGGFCVQSGHHTNLYTYLGDLSEASADYMLKALKDAGVPAEKLVMGAAFYSRMWKGVPDKNNGLAQMAETTGGFGPGYGELKKDYINKNGYIRYWDPEAKAPYLFNGDTFISYEDPESIAYKADYVKQNRLAGIMYWEYGCDTSWSLNGCIREHLDR